MPNPIKPLICIVDDNSDDIFLTKRALTRAGFEGDVETEINAENLLHRLELLQRPGRNSEEILVLLDINMPRVSGFEVLKTLRASSNFADIPVVMLSSSSDPADVSKATALACDGYMEKPFSMEKFAMAIQHLPATPWLA